MFSTKGGLYDQAKKRLKVNDGKCLFTYPFYLRNKGIVQVRCQFVCLVSLLLFLCSAFWRFEARVLLCLQAFFTDIFNEVLGVQPGPSHMSLAALHQCGVLQRHYTMNIDGLASVAGMETWHNKEAPKGSIVEMHGNIRCSRIDQINQLHSQLRMT